MIIAVEGIDGAGKNTLVTAVQEQLGARALAFPRYQESIHAQLAQEALRGKMGDLVDSAYGMATLFALDRAGAKELLETFSHTSDRIIILDRYVASNAAYTTARTGDEAAAKWVFDLEFAQLGLPQPDLQVFVDTGPGEASLRVRRREEEHEARFRDRYERDLQLQQATHEAYQGLAASNWAGHWVCANNARTIIQAVENLS